MKVSEWLDKVMPEIPLGKSRDWRDPKWNCPSVIPIRPVNHVRNSFVWLCECRYCGGLVARESSALALVKRCRNCFSRVGRGRITARRTIEDQIKRKAKEASRTMAPYAALQVASSYAFGEREEPCYDESASNCGRVCPIEVEPAPFEPKEPEIDPDAPHRLDATPVEEQMLREMGWWEQE